MTKERKSEDLSSLKDLRKAHYRHSHHDEELQRSQRVRQPTDAVGTILATTGRGSLESFGSYLCQLPEGKRVISGGG
jgi:hypothetical protein